MIMLYVDNFRGFHDTYIPFADINFLMGENSTGKSSILSILKLIGDVGFWFSQDFNDEDIHLGSFNEIADSSLDKQFFKIGIFDLNNSSTKDSIPYKSILMKFENDKGLPYVSEFNYIIKDNTVSVKIGKKSIKYQVIETPTVPDNYSDALIFFKNWVQEVDVIIKNKYNLVKISSNNQPPLPLICGIIETELETKTKRKEETNSSNKAKPASQSSRSIIFPSFIEKLSWVAPIRAKPRKTYYDYGVSPSSEGAHAPYLLNTLLNFRCSRYI